MKTEATGFNSILNYSLNKFLPIICISILLFAELGLLSWQSYAIIGLSLFMGRFNFQVGYALAICEERGFIKKDD